MSQSSSETKRCPVCGLVGDHKLQCPERPDPPLVVPVEETDKGLRARLPLPRDSDSP